MPEALQGMSPGLELEFRRRAALREQLDDAADKATAVSRAVSLVVPPTAASYVPWQRVPPRPEDDGRKPGTGAAVPRTNRLTGVLPLKIARELSEGKLQRTEVTEAVDEWFESRVRGLVLFGGFGSGKSLHAGYIATLTKPSGPLAPEVSWHRPRGFISGMLHDYDERAPRVGTDLVVVDDVGRHARGEDDLVEALCTLIDERETRFVLTTNHVREELQSLLGGALISRLRDCAWPIAVPDGTWRQAIGDF